MCSFFFSSFNLERSQSLRISKKSLRSLSSKGGSLRLSKKEAANALKQVKEAEENESNCNGELTESTLATPHQSVSVRKSKCLMRISFTAIFQNIPEIFGICVFWVNSFHTCMVGGLYVCVYFSSKSTGIYSV